LGIDPGEGVEVEMRKNPVSLLNVDVSLEQDVARSRATPKMMYFTSPV
jgi:hypothetical protein